MGFKTLTKVLSTNAKAKEIAISCAAHIFTMSKLLCLRKVDRERYHLN